MTQVCGDGNTAQSKSPNFLDAAPYACVESWDPDRTVGARSARDQEFHCDDVFLGERLFRDKGGNGSYSLPVNGAGRCSIALAWPSRRTITELGIQFGDSSPAPDGAATRIEYWEGYSAWQGKWVPLKGVLTQTNQAEWRFAVEGQGQVTQKIRWALSSAQPSVCVQQLTARTPSPVVTTEIVLLSENQSQASHAAIEITNGAIQSNGEWISGRQWDLGSELHLTVRHTERTTDAYTRVDQTLLRVQLPQEKFAVAIDDVLEQGAVYVARLGVLVCKAPVTTSFDQCRANIASRRTVLEQVRAMPDQTREQAMAKVHYARLDLGSVMLSLACDNEKFLLDRNGGITYHDNFAVNVYADGGGFPMPTPGLYHIDTFYGYPRILHASQEFGALGLDTAAVCPYVPTPPLRIQNQAYSKGLGHYADGEIVINLNGEYDRFECAAGVQWTEVESGACVAFQAYTDGQLQFDSGVMHREDAPRDFGISLVGARRLTLRVFRPESEQAPAKNGTQMANWAEARLYRSPASEPEFVADFFRGQHTIGRHLDGGWLPAPVTVADIDGIRYTQRTYVVPVEDSTTPFQIGAKPLGVIELTIENLENRPTAAAARFPFRPVTLKTTGISITVDDANRSARVESGNRVIALIDAGDMDGGVIEVEGSRWTWLAHLPAGSSGRLYLYLPAWNMTIGEENDLPSAPELFARFQRYWDGIMGEGMQIRTPDEWLDNLIRASQVHIYMAARNDNKGERIAPWISSMYYDHAFDSEGNSVVRGMLRTGHFEFARRAFDFYFSRYKPEGFMTTGYTMHGNGWHLRTLAEYMRLSSDFDWLRPRAHYPLRICTWIMAQREKTMKTLANGEQSLEWGLMPPGTEADWPVFAHYFYSEGQYCSGARDMGQVLSQMGFEAASGIIADAGEHRRAIERAFRHAQANAPVVPLRTGAWVPFHPVAMHIAGPVGDHYRSVVDLAMHSWRYDVELGSHHLGYWGILDPNDTRFTDMLDYMEDNQFLRDGADAYPATDSHADWFNLGGFGKLQPYYGQIPELYAARDEVKPFLRSYFNTLASLVNKEVLSIFEGFNPFCINKTHETGYFLSQTREMLIAERGGDLWLAPLVSTNWLQDGMQIEVRNAPTEFGVASLHIRSAIGDGFIEASITAPTRSCPEAIVLRLRHPEGKAIKSVSISDGSPAEIDNSKQTIRFKPSGAAVCLKVIYI